jgi:hypothetical protein
VDLGVKRISLVPACCPVHDKAGIHQRSVPLDSLGWIVKVFPVAENPFGFHLHKQLSTKGNKADKGQRLHKPRDFSCISNCPSPRAIKLMEGTRIIHHCHPPIWRQIHFFPLHLLFYSTKSVTLISLNTLSASQQSQLRLIPFLLISGRLSFQHTPQYLSTCTLWYLIHKLHTAPETLMACHLPLKPLHNLALQALPRF